MTLSVTLDELEQKLNILIEHHEILKNKPLELKEPIEQIHNEIEEIKNIIHRKLNKLEESKDSIFEQLESGKVTDIEQIKQFMKSLELTEIGLIREKLSQLEDLEKIIPDLSQNQSIDLKEQKEKSDLIQQQIDDYKEKFWEFRLGNTLSPQDEEKNLNELHEVEEQEERLQIQLQQLNQLIEQHNFNRSQYSQLHRMREQSILRLNSEIEEQEMKWEELCQPLKERFWNDADLS